MKTSTKIIASIFLSILIITTLGSIAYADNISDLVPRPGELDRDQIERYPELEPLGDLPDVTIEAAIATVVKTILGAAIILTIIAIVVAGLYFIIGEGEEEDVTKGKKIIKYLAIGMFIMSAAYGVVVGISKFEFF